MRKLAEKVAIVALICITFVFALLAVLYASGAIPQNENADNIVAIVLLSTLAVVYVGLSVYLLIVNFSEVLNIKRIVLFYDAQSTTRASHSVINNIVRGCAKEFPQLKIKRTTFRVDDKMGLVANIAVEPMVAEDIANYIPKLKTLLAASFWESLGLKFNAINFDVVKLSKKFTPADTLVEASQQRSEQDDVLTESDESEAFQDTVSVIDVTDDQSNKSKQEDIAAGESKKPADIW